MGTKEEELPEILVKAVMSLYEGSKTKIKVGSVAVGVDQESVLSSLLFAILVGKASGIKIFCQIIQMHIVDNPAIDGTFLCLLMPVPSPDKWGGLWQEGHPA